MKFIVTFLLTLLSAASVYASEAEIILSRSKNFASQVTKEKVTYVVKYSFDLRGKEVCMPSGCVLSFQGGRLKNGTIKGNGTKIKAAKVRILDGITLVSKENF